MDELDSLFQENKESFDRVVSDKNLWPSIQKSLNTEASSRKLTPRWLKIAVSLLLLIGIGGIWSIGMDDGARFRNLSLESLEGEKIMLDPSLNKFTLIQFWASGNVLCDEMNCYYYLPAYEKYKDQGFEIYAISLDQDKEKWMESIEENKLSWIHVSDLKGWESPICMECNITKIPSSFLLDQKGNVILENVNAEVLDETLGRLFAEL